MTFEHVGMLFERNYEVLKNQEIEVAADKCKTYVVTNLFKREQKCKAQDDD